MDIRIKSYNSNLKDINKAQDIDYEVISDNNICSIYITNNSNKEIILEKLEVDVVNLDKNGYENIIFKSEYGDDIYNALSINSNNLSNQKSFMFSVIKGKGDFQNVLVGFLSSHVSRNYVTVNREKRLNITCVYDFGHMELKPYERIKLDDIFIKQDYKYYNIFNDYIKQLTKNIENEHDYSDFNFIEDNLLFSKSSNDSVLRHKGKEVYVSINGKNYYMINIIDDKAKSKIIDRCIYMIAQGKNVIKVTNLKFYINKIIELKLFNPYFEISKLFNKIRESVNSNVCFAFDDCPTGIAVGNFEIYYSSIDLNVNKKFFSKLVTKNLDPNYDNLFVRMMIDNTLFLPNTEYKVKNTNMKKMLAKLNLNIDKDILKCSDRYCQPGYYEKKKNVFSIWREFNETVYIGVFNNTENKESIYIDFSQYSNYLLDTGRVEDMVTKTQYLIDHNKVYIKNVKPGGCILLKKIS